MFLSAVLKSKPGSGSESMEATARSSQSDAEASDGGSIAEMVGYHCGVPVRVLEDFPQHEPTSDAEDEDLLEQ